MINPLLYYPDSEAEEIGYIIKVNWKKQNRIFGIKLFGIMIKIKKLFLKI